MAKFKAKMQTFNEMEQEKDPRRTERASQKRLNSSENLEGLLCIGGLQESASWTTDSQKVQVVFG